MADVKTQQGTVRGIRCETENGCFYAFKGIPYAKPPIGKLRFKAPLPPEPWSGVRDASEHGPVCPQYNERLDKIEIGSEDCLYLNVYTKTLNTEKRLPVLVWIHGGGFYTGSGNSDFYGPEFFMEHEIVMVTINYRLEVFGFLCLDTEEVPGNAGLKDQVAALKWVKNNIHSFGGDSENVTIFGCSAGSASTSYHMISEMSSGLFSKAVCQSGVCLNEWSYNIHARQTAFQLGKLLGNDTEDVTELLEFLRDVPAESLINVKLPAINTKYPDISDSLMFSPVVEKSTLNVEKFISESPPSLIKKGRAAKVPIMLGYTSADGIEICRNFPKSLTFLSIMGMVIPREIKLNMPLEQMKMLDEKIRLKYFGSTNITEQNLEECVNLTTDIVFAYNTRRLARYHYKNTSMPIYFYKFQAETERNYMKKKYKMEQVPGVCHGDEQYYQFDVKNLNIPLTNNSKSIVQNVVKLWVNFASYGNPTTDYNDVEWKPFKEDERNCFIIDKQLKCEVNVDEERMLFWDEIYGEKRL